MAAIYADDIFECILLDENVWISIEISLKFVPKGPIKIFYHYFVAWSASSSSRELWLLVWFLMTYLTTGFTYTAYSMQ